MTNVCSVESVQAWSSLLKCLTVTFKSSLNFFCAVAVISLAISKCICISEEEAGSIQLPWRKEKGLFLVTSVCVSPWKEKFMQFE